MPLFADDDRKPTGDIFTDARNKLRQPTASSTAGTMQPRANTVTRSGVPLARAPGPGQISTSTGSIYSDRAAQGHTEPRIFSRDGLGTNSSGQTRRYVGTVNIGAGDRRRTLGFRTTRDFNHAQALVARRNKFVAGVRADAARRGISLKEAQDMNTTKKTGLSFGEKILQNAGTSWEAGEKKHIETDDTGLGKPRGWNPFGKKRRDYNASKKINSIAKRSGLDKRNQHDNALPRSKQRAMRKMVPPGTFEKKELEAGEKGFGNAIVKAGSNGVAKAGKRLPPTRLVRLRNATRATAAGTAAGAAGGFAAGSLNGKPKKHNPFTPEERAAVRASKEFSFGEKILSQAGSRLESSEKDKGAGGASRYFGFGSGYTSLNRTAGKFTAGNLKRKGVGDDEIRKRVNVTNKRFERVGTGVGAAVGAGYGGVLGHIASSGLRSKPARIAATVGGALGLGTAGGALSRASQKFAGRRVNRGVEDVLGKKSAETDSFGKTVLDQARARLPQE